MKFTLFAGSLRKGSYNRKLLAIAAQKLKNDGIEIVIHDLTELAMPVYNAEIEEKGFPDGVKTLASAISHSDAVVISSPEYNGGMSGVLKNAMDWVSRIKPVPWKDKPLFLMAASPGALGGTRGLWHGRVPFEVAGCFVYPEMFGLPKANEAFDDKDQLKDPKTKERLYNLLDAFIPFVKNNNAR
jgi:chromate reductase